MRLVTGEVISDCLFSMAAADDCEPAPKRPKLATLADTTTTRLLAILPAECEQELPLTPVYVSRIAVKQNISMVMQELCKLLPLTQLQHLKRVHQQDVIIGAVRDVAETSVRVYLQSAQLSAHVIDCLCANVQQRTVPAAPPKLRFQYEAARHHWPCKFHPDKYLEALHDGTIFDEAQQRWHGKMVRLLLKFACDAEAQKPCGICVDPRTGSLVALAASRTRQHPLMHCAMVLVDYVARTQNSGAWNDKITAEFVAQPGQMADAQEESVTLAGIERRYFEFVQRQDEFKNIKFGAECVRSYNEKISREVMQETASEAADNLAKYGPYLCTGYDVYLSEEPCLMCAMALVHSRVRRIFFVRRSTNGALVSRLRLHAIRELNHHYEVFQCEVTQEKQEEQS